ncbi:hypothetical protein MBLNU459_g4136t2 [Dothideomycetes sp. NU459]
MAYRKDSAYPQLSPPVFADGTTGTPGGGNGSFTPVPMSQPTVPRLQMFGVGGPQGSGNPVPDPFAWSGQAPQAPMQLFHQSLQQISQAPIPAGTNAVPPTQSAGGVYPGQQPAAANRHPGHNLEQST